MANQKNLISIGERTKEEQREITKKGGKASVASRRRKKRLAEIVKLALQTQCESSDELTHSDKIALAMICEAEGGNVQAAKWVADLVGEGATFELKKQELKLKKAAIKSAEAQGANTSSAMQQLVDSLLASGET